MNPTVRYLFRETALRWKTRPSSPLARCLLTLTLCVTAAAFLAGLDASARALRMQLARQGMDTLSVRSFAPAGETAAGLSAAQHWSQPLAQEGVVHALTQLPGLAETDWGTLATVYVAPWVTLAQLREADSSAADDSPAVWLTREWPEHRGARFTLGAGTRLQAASRRPEGAWRLLGDGDALLLPAELVPAEQWRGVLDVVLFTPMDVDALGFWADAIRRMFRTDNAPPPAIQDPAPLRDALRRLEQGQGLWRWAILGLLGAGVLLVFGAIGVLEQREMRFAQALLRSLGVRPRLLWAAALGENLVLANAAFIGAIAGTGAYGTRLLQQLPAFEGIGPLQPGGEYFLAAAVNAGVIVSLLPLARALHTPIGTQLS